MMCFETLCEAHDYRGESSQELGPSEKTIAHHLTHIFNKTTSENRAAAAAFAICHGLAAMSAALVAMVAALTILPALLAVLGRRINALFTEHKILLVLLLYTIAQNAAWYPRYCLVNLRPPLVNGLRTRCYIPEFQI